MGWDQAFTRAGAIAGADHPGGPDDTVWDFVAARGIIAIVLQALGDQTPDGPESVSLGSALWHLAQGPGTVRELAEPLVGHAAHAVDTDPATMPSPNDPALAGILIRPGGDRFFGFPKSWPRSLGPTLWR
ncbi:hypothetical protein ACFV2X_52315, partial [Streptomyces sp. NPDC059679]|uniref:hypothetical protein n=1 Tax=Streptomyces sp. NPDC059679 TaxID=3346903 RepID=UPI00369D809A